MNRKFYKRRNVEKKLNEIMRKLCCWNCFQTGHKRFQCPFPKVNLCSFCRRPFILSVECGCPQSKAHLDVSEHQIGNVPSININGSLKDSTNDLSMSYNENVVVPIHHGNSLAGYETLDNMVVVVDNNNDMDILEIHAEDESLDNL